MEEKEALVRTIEALNASIAAMSENHKKEVDGLNQRIKELTAQVAWLNRQLFGRKSERLAAFDPGQMDLFAEEKAGQLRQAEEARDEAVEKIAKTKEDRRREKRNRLMMEDLPVLEREVITPEGEDNARLTPEMTVRIEKDICEEGKTPSSFARLFSNIFEAHPDIGSLAAARPPHATAFALTGTPFDPRVHSEGYVFLRRISRLPFGTPVKDPGAIVRSIGMSSPIVMIDSDCVIAAGSSPLDAFNRLEVLESVAESLCAVASVKSLPVRISDEGIADIDELFGF